MTKFFLICAIFFCPPVMGQTAHIPNSDIFFDSVVSALKCSGAGFLDRANNKKSTRRICCAYHVKEAYDSLIARRELLDQQVMDDEEDNTGKPKKGSYCEQLETCYKNALKQNASLLKKLWAEYEAGLKEAGQQFDAQYNPTLKKLETQCYLKWDPSTGIMRQVNTYGPSLIKLKLANMNACLTLAVDITNKLQKIYGEMEEKCLAQVMKSDLVPLCPDLFWDPTDLYGTIAELYENINATKVKECGQPLLKEDCCTVIPSKGNN